MLLITTLLVNIILGIVATNNYENRQQQWEFSSFQSKYYKEPSKANLRDYFFQSEDTKVQNAIEDARDTVERWKIEMGIPGVVAGVSVKGRELWTEAFGYSDLENGVHTTKQSVWRIASISKSLTSGLVGKLIDEGLMDLDKPIASYLNSDIFTSKLWKGHDYRSEITLKQVMSHTAGMRMTKLPDDFTHSVFVANNLTYAAKIEAIQFKDDPLLFEPSKNWSYSNYGYQCIGAAIESVLLNKKNETYEYAINDMFTKLGMYSTMVERREMIIPHRTRYYQRDGKKIVLENANIIDDLFIVEGNWPSAGIVSTVPDLLKFGNYMLKSFKDNNGFLKQSTILKLWTPSNNIPLSNIVEPIHSRYAHGWIITNLTNNSPWYKLNSLIYHSGGLYGTSTQLQIYPEQDMVVAVFANCGFIEGLQKLALNIAMIFSEKLLHYK